MKIQQIMHQGVETITPENTIKEAARKMHDLHVGALPVVDGDRVLGIITDRDICCKVVATGHDAVMTKVHEVMSKDLSTCYDDQEVEVAAELMASQHIHRLAIMSRNNTLSGMLSVDDLTLASLDMAGTVLEASATH